MATKKNLNRNTVRMLRKVQRFLMEEPRRFNMREGVVSSTAIKDQLEQPPCGTACCIAGAIYILGNSVALHGQHIGFIVIEHYAAAQFNLRGSLASRLFFYNSGLPDERWPNFYANAYQAAQTPLERACIGVARIEHFIATDGQE
jgi:hypothetical protein